MSVGCAQVGNCENAHFKCVLREGGEGLCAPAHLSALVVYNKGMFVHPVGPFVHRAQVERCENVYFRCCGRDCECVRACVSVCVYV